MCTEPGSKPVTDVPVRTTMPNCRIASPTMAPMSGSSVAITSAPCSTTVTVGQPRRTKASAISRPM